MAGYILWAFNSPSPVYILRFLWMAMIFADGQRTANIFADGGDFRGRPRFRAQGFNSQARKSKNFTKNFRKAKIFGSLPRPPFRKASSGGLGPPHGQNFVEKFMSGAFSSNLFDGYKIQSLIWPREFILAEKMHVVDLSSWTLGNYQ